MVSRNELLANAQLNDNWIKRTNRQELDAALMQLLEDSQGKPPSGQAIENMRHAREDVLRKMQSVESALLVADDGSSDREKKIEADYEGHFTAPISVSLRAVRAIAEKLKAASPSLAELIDAIDAITLANESLSAASNASTPRRQGDLSTLIEMAQSRVKNPTSASDVFQELRLFARDKVPPFFGVTDEGLQWVDSSDKPKILSKKNLADRLRRKSA